MIFAPIYFLCPDCHQITTVDDWPDHHHADVLEREIHEWLATVEGRFEAYWAEWSRP